MLNLFLSFFLPNDEAKRPYAYAGYAIIAVVILLIVFFKVIRPRLIANKTKKFNAIWQRDRDKIHAALKTVFYPDLVDSWVNIQDMIDYKAVDIDHFYNNSCPCYSCCFCGGKVIERVTDGIQIYDRVLNGKIDGKDVSISLGTYTEETPRTYSANCEKCGHIFVQEHVTLRRLEIKWRTPEVEEALGKEMCAFIQRHGNFKRKEKAK